MIPPVKGSFAEVSKLNIDAAFLNGYDNKLDLLKGDQYVRLTFIVGQGATMDQGYPQPISNWLGLPN
ncbi:MAG: hemopexin repeat-containing protein [Candidatus Nitrosocosmicus sp.]